MWCSVLIITQQHGEIHKNAAIVVDAEYSILKLDKNSMQN